MATRTICYVYNIHIVCLQSMFYADISCCISSYGLVAFSFENLNSLNSLVNLFTKTVTRGNSLSYMLSTNSFLHIYCMASLLTHMQSVVTERKGH